MLAKALITDEDVLERVMADQQNTQPLKLDMPHPPMKTKEDMVAHIRDMVNEGYTNEQILEIHPEIAEFFNNGGNENG